MKIGFFGANFTTSNLGVSALAYSVLTGIKERIPEAEFIVFDYGKGIRTESIIFKNEKLSFLAASNICSINFLRDDNLIIMNISSFFKGILNKYNKLIKSCDIIIDITGGDSFTDLYGDFRFHGSCLRKEIPTRLGKQIILLPQTYGPFKKKAHQKRVLKILKSASLIYSRDKESIEYIKEIGNAIAGQNSLNIYQGVDVAFLLPVHKSDHKLPEAIQKMIAQKNTEIVGINVSGLTWKEGAKERFDLKVEYQELIQNIIKFFLNANVQVFLIPHVGAIDYNACEEAKNHFSTEEKQNIHLIPYDFDQNEIKWVINQCDLFLGTRMHATIAGISTFTPTLNLAYSKKAAGVFETCGIQDYVLDMTKINAEQIQISVEKYWSKRKDIKKELTEKIPIVVNLAKKQLDHICQFIKESKK